ncbi:phage scaffolding protein [Limosilactobacillus fermentum]
MKREFLKDMKLTDEQIDAIMAENGKDVNGLKEQVNSLTTEKDGLQSQLTERDTQLKDLKGKVKDSDELTAEINNLQKANKEAKEKYEANLTAQQKSFLVDKALASAGARNAKAVSSLLDLDSVEVKDGQLTGLDDQLKALRESDGYMFKEDPQPSEPQPQGGVQITLGQPNPEGAPKTIDLAHATYQEIKAFKDEHPDEFTKMTAEEK